MKHFVISPPLFCLFLLFMDCEIVVYIVQRKTPRLAIAFWIMAGKEFNKPDNISAHQEDKTRIIAGAVSMSFRWP